VHETEQAVADGSHEAPARVDLSDPASFVSVNGIESMPVRLR
jgi:hypothetical protein